MTCASTCCTRHDFRPMDSHPPQRHSRSPSLVAETQSYVIRTAAPLGLRNDRDDRAALQSTALVSEELPLLSTVLWRVPVQPWTLERTRKRNAWDGDDAARAWARRYSACDMAWGAVRVATGTQAMPEGEGRWSASVVSEDGLRVVASDIGCHGVRIWCGGRW